MYQSEIRPCALCGKDVGSNWRRFVRARIEVFQFEKPSAQQLELKADLGVPPDVAVLAQEPVTFFVCQGCAVTQRHTLGWLDQHVRPVAVVVTSAAEITNASGGAGGASHGSALATTDPGDPPL